ncbi:hypothetical protein GCM10008949_03850 [Deinococcus humi]|nr:hypothetical protein GCM10008949_03850 [Deinococcus humi]
MQEMDYQFIVYTPGGSYLKTIERDATHLRNTGMRLQVTSEGDGLEARFDAKGAGILIPPLHTVQIRYKVNDDFRAIYYGQVRQGGNSRNVDGEAYILRSLALRLDAVTLSPGFTTPEQPAHLTVRALMEDVVASGQLGSTIQYFDARVIDLGFNARAVEKSNSQMAGALLRQLVEDGVGLGVDVRYGVDASTYFYCRPAVGSVLTLAPEERGAIEQLSPVAEKPVTAVQWFLAQDENKDAVTYISRSPESELGNTWTKNLAIDPNRVPAWAKAEGTYQWVDAAGADITGSVSYSFISPEGNVSTEGYELLRDGVMKSNSGRLSAIVPQGGRLRFTPSLPHRRARIAVAGAPVELSDGSTAGVRLLRTMQDGTTQAVGVPIGAGAGAFGESTLYTDDPGVGVTAYTLEATATVGTGGTVVWNLFEFRAEALDTALLDRLAKFHYSLPAVNPADVTLKTFRTPDQLTEQVELDDGPMPVAAWEYRISGGRGLECAALLGQRLAPEVLAQASLIRALDNEAVITAVTARG